MLAGALLIATVTGRAEGVPAELSKYNVVWDSPSADAAGSMPIGNGEVILNVWVEKTTGDLRFYIGRSDSLSELGRILKVGSVRVHFSNSPWQSCTDFSQTLRLTDGAIAIQGGGLDLKLFVDSDADVVHLEGSSKTQVAVKATVESWRLATHTLEGDEGASAWSTRGGPDPLTESADHFETDDRSVTWYHRNEYSAVPELLANQSLTGLPGAFDPLLHRTFGARLTGEGFQQASDRSLDTTGSVRKFDLKIATATTVGDLDGWRKKLDETEAKSKAAAERTQRWWNGFWNRSWIFASDETVTRGLVLQRYVQACQSRGAYPIKFNGGTYTVEPAAMHRPYNPDWRNWGDAQWFQNLRHMQHPMPAQGDIEMMEPMFRLYESVVPLAESRTQKYWGAKGVWFPETMTWFGTYAGSDYGWDRKGLNPNDVQSPWWRYAWNQGPELVALMLDRWDATNDKAFLKRELLPMAVTVLNYFDTRFKKDSEGRVILDPAQSVETYWVGVVNDMPTTAGLIAVTERLCNLPKGTVSAKDRTFFEKMRKACPVLPIRTVDGQTELSPAQKFNPEASNVENPELYAVWPFRLATVGRPELLEAARRSYAHRVNHLDVGWGYDGNVAALLGMPDEAARILTIKSKNSNKAYRWPATWGPNFDWLPDQNHGGNYLTTASLMLVQADPIEGGGKIRLLPAWPKAWDVDFKLHAPGNTVVHAVVKGGTVQMLEVSPKSRLKDVEFGTGWSAPAG